MESRISTEVAGRLRLCPSIGTGTIRVLGLHGYSYGPASLLPLILGAKTPQIEWILPPLPGHGEGESVLTASSLQNSLDRWVEEFRPAWILGFSLGARAALSRSGVPVFAVSPPIASTFAPDDRDELLTYLNPRRVRETQPMGGLAEILEKFPLPKRTAPAHVFVAQRDLRSVREGETALRALAGVSVHRIDRCRHGDIGEMPDLHRALRQTLAPDLIPSTRRDITL